MAIGANVLLEELIISVNINFIEGIYREHIL